MDSGDLPKGWLKEEVIRKSGISAGKTDIYYHGPNGKKYRSKPQIARELGSDCDLTAFDFKAGQTMSQSAMVRRAKGKKTPYDFAKGSRDETNLALPIRQTASIFKQPVTIIRSHPDSQSRPDLKHGNPEASQPRQLFWEKSLSDVKMGQLGEQDLTSIVLPSKIKGIGPDMTNENLLQSIAAALHLNHSPVVGQSQTVSKFAKNPTVHINTSQPLIQQVVITDEDIKQQQTKVASSRRKVEELLIAIEKNKRERLLKEDTNLSESQSEGSPGSSTGSPSTQEIDNMDKAKAFSACDPPGEDVPPGPISKDSDQGNTGAANDGEPISISSAEKQTTSPVPLEQKMSDTQNPDGMSLDRSVDDETDKMDTETADNTEGDAAVGTNLDTSDMMGL